MDNVYGKRGSSAGDKALVRRLDKLLDVAMEDEIQETLPAALQATQTQAFTDWFAQPPSTRTPATDN